MSSKSTLDQNTKAIMLMFVMIALVFFATISEARLYKWVDTEGNTRYGDQLPPGYANKKHFQLDAEGRIILTNEAGKSPKQLKKERVFAKQVAEEKEKADREAAKLLKKQNQQDRILLLTFNSEDDIFYARDQRLQVLDSKISLLNKNKLSSQKKLTILNEQAEAQYRSKQLEVPGGLQQKIEQMGKKIKTTDTRIAQSEHKRAEVVGNFKKDLTRFRNLKVRQRKNQK